MAASDFTNRRCSSSVSGVVGHWGLSSSARAPSRFPQRRPSPSSTGCVPVICCQRFTVTSTYLGSISYRSRCGPRVPPRRASCRSQERLIAKLTTSSVVHNGLRISSIGFCVGWSNFSSRAAHDEFRRRRVPNCRVLTRFAIPGRIRFSTEPRGLVATIRRARQHGTALVQMICWW